MKFWKAVLFFCIGGWSYIGLEFLWRGWSHYSMFLAGGTCFLLLGRLRREKLPFLLKGIVGAGIITMVELLAGLLFNRRYTVWDYRGMPWNLWGQICLPFFFLWIPISFAAMLLHRWAESAFSRDPERSF